jgi:hypothetical protein
MGVAAAAVLAGGTAEADVMISGKATANMTCQAGVCSPTASKAVLNATDLANMLADGDEKVTTGSGATNIAVKDAFSWTSTSRLTLDAMQSVEIDKPVMVTGTGAVTVTTNDGGTGGDLIFDGKGNVTFWDLASSLIVNGNSYTLVKKLKDLRSAISNGTSFVALAGNYNAHNDGTYRKAVIATVGGNQTIEGLGNQIQNLTIIVTHRNELALVHDNQGAIRDLGLTNVNVDARPTDAAAGLAFTSAGTIRNCFVTGTVQGWYAGGLAYKVLGTVGHSYASVAVTGEGGGLAVTNEGTIETSYATGAVTGRDIAGGLVGANNGTISQSFATGPVTGSYAVGGLVGLQEFLPSGTISNSYATGSVNGETSGPVGGLAGTNYWGAIESSYSTGLVTGHSNAVGGFVGDVASDSNTDDYWNLDTSGIDDPHRGAGDFPDDPGITGLTDAQLKSGLPADFSPKVWGQSASINNGYPYLLANPPPQWGAKLSHY